MRRSASWRSSANTSIRTRCRHDFEATAAQQRVLAARRSGAVAGRWPRQNVRVVVIGAGRRLHQTDESLPPSSQRASDAAFHGRHVSGRAIGSRLDERPRRLEPAIPSFGRELSNVARAPLTLISCHSNVCNVSTARPFYCSARSLAGHLDPRQCRSPERACSRPARPRRGALMSNTTAFKSRAPSLISRGTFDPPKRPRAVAVRRTGRRAARRPGVSVDVALDPAS